MKVTLYITLLYIVLEKVLHGWEYEKVLEKEQFCWPDVPKFRLTKLELTLMF